MPTITLTFNLPDEREEFELANHGTDFASVINDLSQYLSQILRGKISDQITLNEGTDLQKDIRLDYSTLEYILRWINTCVKQYQVEDFLI